MGIPPNGVDRGGLGGTRDGAIKGEQSTEKGVNQGRAEHVGVEVIEQSMDWKTSFANCAWLILWVAVY